MTETLRPYPLRFFKFQVVSGKTLTHAFSIGAQCTGGRRSCGMVYLGLFHREFTLFLWNRCPSYMKPEDRWWP